MEAAEKYDEASLEHGKYFTTNFNSSSTTATVVATPIRIRNTVETHVSHQQNTDKVVNSPSIETKAEPPQEKMSTQDNMIGLGQLILISIGLRREIALEIDPVRVLRLLNRLDLITSKKYKLSNQILNSQNSESLTSGSSPSQLVPQSCSESDSVSCFVPAFWACEFQPSSSCSMDSDLTASDLTALSLSTNCMDNFFTVREL